MFKDIEVSIIVPVYNAEKHIEKLYNQIRDVLNEKVTFEIIFVEDCGKDNSWDVLQSLDSKANITIVKLSKNFGQHAATMCGITNAKGKWIVTIDDDLEQNPKDILKLYEEANKGYDLVYGVFKERSHSMYRNFTSYCARKLFTAAIPSLNYEYTSFRIIKSSIAKELLKFDSPYPFIDGYLSWITNNYSTVQVSHSERESGTSNYTFSKLLKHTLNISISFSEIPLKISSWVGILASGIGVLWLILIVLQRLMGTVTVSGYASTMAAILFIGGIQLLVLGVIGEYIFRISFKTSKKPVYIVGDIQRKEVDISGSN